MYAVFANFLFFNQYLPHIAYYRAAMGGKYYQPSECVVSDMNDYRFEKYFHNGAAIMAW